MTSNTQLAKDAGSYVLRLVEQTIVGGAVGFFAALEATGGEIGKSSVAAAIGAGIRAAYGILTKPLGDQSQPSLTK
jgi:hypothetical protein